MKTLQKVGLTVFGLATLLGLSSMVAAAQGPVASLTAFNAPYVDNSSHPIQAGASTWYRFDYAVNHDTNDRPVTTITLPNGFATGIGFEVWSQNGAADVTNNDPVGRGSPAVVQNDGAATQTADLKWVGAFGSSGPYFVRVTNTTMNNATAQLMISGDGVRLAPIAVTGDTSTQSTTGTATAPSTATQPGAGSDDPAKAVALNGTQQSVPAHSAQWFTFNYTINADGSGAHVHPIVQIQLVNGTMSGLTFQVYSPENIGNWFDNTPTGTGSPMMVTGGDSGTTQSANLNYSGAFGSSGTYYVRVVNNTSNAIPATLMVSWPN